jgi:chloride channel protein, CIC family
VTSRECPDEPPEELCSLDSQTPRRAQAFARLRAATRTLFALSPAQVSRAARGSGSLQDADESPTIAERLGRWLAHTRLGFSLLAALVGFVAGLGAIAFRWMIFGLTWLATGSYQFGQQGRTPGDHLAFLGLWVFIVVPVVGGLLYGPLIERYAKEARGHGVPEVMYAVSEQGGRIRPQVTVVKALASALCIGSGGSVGREGPIVQIGSAFASSVGQILKMPENRMRTLVACGAAGGISGTFNAPVTGAFFGFELILRSFIVDAIFPMILASAVADLISRVVFGTAPIFSSIPHDLVVVHSTSYLLVIVLGLVCGVVGVGFKNVLYTTEDLFDTIWAGRPEWLRPAAGGVLLGVILLALPGLYGVGYPVIQNAVDGHTVLWLLIVLAIGKIVATSVTLGIGGSGGIFAPSLFAGAMTGTAFGFVANDAFGPAAGHPALYGVVAMGAVFGAATRAPFTSIASATEMTGNFHIAAATMLAVAIAVGLSTSMTHGTIYTTKLLRRGVDIDKPRAPTVART